MSGRITWGMMNTQFMRNYNANLNTMSGLQEQMATGKKINKPSDDPVGLSYSLRYRAEIGQNDQYQSNVSSATSWLDFTDSTLGEANDVFQRIRELMVQGANGGNSQSSLDAIKTEVGQLKQHLAGIGNSQFNGKYVLNGQITDKPPYSKADNAVNYDNGTGNADIGLTDNGAIQFELSPGMTVPVNVTGNQIFGGPTDSDNVFKVMDQFTTDLTNGDTSAISNLLGTFDSRMNKLLEVRSDVGAKSNRVNLISQHLTDSGINLQTLQSKTEDADMAVLITNLKTSQNVYEASLSVGAKILQPSLVDFLK